MVINGPRVYSSKHKPCHQHNWPLFVTIRHTLVTMSEKSTLHSVPCPGSVYYVPITRWFFLLLISACGVLITFAYLPISIQLERSFSSKYHPPVDGSLQVLHQLAKARNCSTQPADRIKRTFLFCPPPKRFVRFAVFSATPNITGSLYGYVFYLPLTARAWARVGYGSLVILVGSYYTWTANDMTLYVLHALVDKGAGIVFIQTPHPDNDVTVAQTSRLFAGHLFKPFLSENDIILTSDADLWPIDRHYYSNISSKTIVVLNAYCCGHFNYLNRSVRMFPMSSVITSVGIWQALFPCHPGGGAVSSETILAYLANFYGPAVRQAAVKGGKGWEYDQKVVSIRVEDFAMARGQGSVRLRDRQVKDRIDRAWFSVPRYLVGKRDAHLPLEPHLVPAWNKVRTLLYRMYGRVGAAQGHAYYQGFRTAMVAEASKRCEHCHRHIHTKVPYLEST